MPYSSNSGKAYCDRAVTRMVHQLFHTLFDHHRVLDLGIGCGTYSDRYARTLLPRGKFYWTGVEVWAPYVDRFGLEGKYDLIALTDAISFLRQSDDKHDICFMGDVLEHVSVDDAKILMNLALERCNAVILSIPLGHHPQEEFEGNPYEKHVKDDWTHDEVMRYWSADVVEYGIEKEIGVYVLSRKKKNLLKDVLRPQVAVYAICKNERHFLDRFYRSIEDADFITIVDTGSTDGSFEHLIELVKLHTEQHGHEEEFKVELGANGLPRNAHDGMMHVHQAWVDPWRFDDARNIALSLVPEAADVCISVDLDEVLTEGWKETIYKAVLEDLHRYGMPSDRYYHRFSTIWNWDKPGQPQNFTDHWHERIHSRRGFRWKLPVHEVLVCDHVERVQWLHDFKMIQLPDTSKPRSSYLLLLEQSLKEDPTRWKSWSFYASDLTGVGRYQDAINALTKAKALPDADLAHLAYQTSTIYRMMGDNAKAVAELWTAINNSDCREYRVWLARLYRDINKPREALSLVMMASEIQNQTSGYTYDPTCWGPQFDQLVDQLTAECKR